jgi:hypothetical protein
MGNVQLPGRQEEKGHRWRGIRLPLFKDDRFAFDRESRLIEDVIQSVGNEGKGEIWLATSWDARMRGAGRPTAFVLAQTFLGPLIPGCRLSRSSNLSRGKKV